MATSKHHRSRNRPARPEPRVDRTTRPPTINHRAATVLLEMILEARRQQSVTDPSDDAA